MNNKWTTKIAVVVSLIITSLILTNNVFAHGDEDHSKDKGSHGGQIVAVDDVKLEMTVDGQTIQLYVTDQKGNPIDATGAKGSLLVLSKRHKTKLSLSSVENNILSATGKFATHKKMKVIVTLEMPGKSSLKARFTPLK